MKTPRELLLERHRGMEAKLDRVRSQAIATLSGRPAKAINGISEAERGCLSRSTCEPASIAAAAETAALRQISSQPASNLGYCRAEATSLRSSRLLGLKDLALSAVISLWQELIWPSRRIWAGLGAVWVGLLVIHAGAGPREASDTRAGARPEAIQAFAEQKRVLAEVLQAANPEPAEAPRPLPQPRSEGLTAYKEC